MEKSRDKGLSYSNKLKLVREYNREHYKAMTIRFDYVKDRDIIDHLENIDSNKKYIAHLIRKDIEDHGKEES